MNKTPLTNEYIKLLNKQLRIGQNIPISAAAQMKASTDFFGEYTDSLAVDSLEFSKWKIQTLELIETITGNSSQYFKNFNKINKPVKSEVAQGLGLLLALKENLNRGYIQDLKSEILSIEYTTLLETADRFLKNNKKDPAGVLAGVALEETLRQISNKYKIKHPKKSNLSSLNDIIADSKKVYDNTLRKQIKGWNDVRDKAAHAEWQEFSKIQVKHLIEGTTKLIEDYL